MDIRIGARIRGGLVPQRPAADSLAAFPRRDRPGRLQVDRALRVPAPDLPTQDRVGPARAQVSGTFAMCSLGTLGDGPISKTG